MALQIIENDGVYMLKGAINNSTALSFAEHMKALMVNHDEVTINIGQVHEIDPVGLKIIRELHARNKNQSFSVVGYGCKAIYDELRDK